MNTNEQLCMGCMHSLPEGRAECGICGYPTNGNNAPQFLPVGTVLSERYLVGKVLNLGGDAAVYIGYDRVLKAAIQIREFFPDTISERKPNGELSVIGGCDKTFQDYFEKFRSHARALARMRDLTSIVTVYDIFEQNNTVYTISEFCEGITLETRLKQAGGRLRWEDARPLFMPLMASIISLHSAGVFHLGICPKNLIVSTDGKLVLQGFSIAEARKANTDLRPQLAAGYSAPEQYEFDKETSAATDVYGLAATIFRALTGAHPPEGQKRAKDSNDLYVPASIANELPDYVAAALFNALQENPENRTQKIQSFRDQLSTAPAVSALIKDEKNAQKVANSPVPVKDEPSDKKKNKDKKYGFLIAIIVFLLLLLTAGITLLIVFPDRFFKNDSSSEISSSVSDTLTSSTTDNTTAADSNVNKVEIDKVVGEDYYSLRDKTFNGKKLIVEFKQYSNKPKGEILSQTPEAGSMAPQGTQISVIISAGSEDITVPDVKGWDANHAEAYLKALGFRVTTTRVASTYEYNTVESVDSAGKSLKEGSMVTLRVSDTHQTTTASQQTYSDSF